MIRAGDHLGAQAAPVVLEQHGEFVAAEARRGVRRARALRQAGGDGAQQVVAGGVADAVVDRLEAVEVDEEHAEVGLAPGRHVERVLQAVQEERAVGQPGEGVVEGLLHRLHRARIAEGEARVLGEGVEHAELGVVEGGARGRHRDERTGAGAVDVDRRRQGRLVARSRCRPAPPRWRRRQARIPTTRRRRWSRRRSGDRGPADRRAPARPDSRRAVRWRRR